MCPLLHCELFLLFVLTCKQVLNNTALKKNVTLHSHDNG